MPILTRISCSLLLWLTIATGVLGQQPVPEMPRVYVDTSYRHPEGARIFVRNGGDLQSALDAVNPGGTVILEAGATFIGNFALAPKTGTGWIYIESSAIDSLARPGRRTSPAEAKYMARVQTPNSTSAIAVLPGAANYRIIGLEITPSEGAPRVYHLVNIDSASSDVESHLRDFAQRVAPALVGQDQFPHNITIDRCYIHGSEKQDVRQGVVANGIAVAVIDSYISDIHDSTMDSQGILVYRTPGPIKIVNNLVSSTTENIMFGGAGGTTNPYVPSDIEIRWNWLFKPLSWIPLTTIPPFKWSVKNNLEFKSAQRAIVTGNLLENNWKSGQIGYSVVLTPRTADDQGGPNTVVDDITIESNILKNVVSGFSTLEQDDGCKPPSCKWPGEEKRLKIDNNLILFMPSKSPGWDRNWGFSVAVNLTDVVFQHNTMVLADYSTADQSLWFNSVQGWPWPPLQPYTHNLWVLDNVLSRQPSGDSAGLLGTRGLTYYMGDPAPLDKRFMGNVMYVPSGDTMPSYPPRNSLQTKIAFADPAAGNYQLTAPKWTQTSDGALAGVNAASLQAAMNPDAGP